MKRFPACILATCCVPWDQREQLDEEAFRRGIRRSLRATRNLYVFGTAGEGYAVTERQFDQVTEVFAEEMRSAGAEPMVGVIHLALATMVERMERCRARGVRWFQIVLPSWGEVSDRELEQFFDRTCGQFTDCQFLHYNLPRARRILTGTEYAKLAERHPNLVATKNTGDSLSHLRSLLAEAPQLQHFLSESGYAYGSLFGECGLLASLVTSWERLETLFQAGQRKDVAALAEIQGEVDVFLKTIWETVGRGRIDGAYDKLFVKVHDLQFPLRLLPPYEGVGDPEFQAFHQRLGQRLPNWIP